MNGVAITGLQPAGTSIPGNDGYPVDSLVRTEAPQLSLHGFGYALADGTYANPFYGDHFVPPGVYAFFSDPANRKTSEPLVKFEATKIAVARPPAAPAESSRLDHDGRLYERALMIARPLIRLRRR